MNPFNYSNATRLVYGKGAIASLGVEVARHVPAGATVLVVYGGGSAKRNGTLAQATESLARAGLAAREWGGVRPNPTVEFVRETIAEARAVRAAALVAVGGGSVIDNCKAAAIGAPYDGDVWDYFCGKATPRQAGLPVFCVLTIPAAGSEQSIRCVISSGEQKRGAGNEYLRPVASFIDPAVFTTLPPAQVAAGVVDMMSHIFERYFTNTEGVEFTSGQAEAALRCAMRFGLALAKDPKDVAAWSEIGLVGAYAHCGYYGLGHVEDWACHGIEHALSGWDARITHGAGLAVVIPSWMRHVWKANPARFLRFATRVMGVRDYGCEAETIEAAITRLQGFYRAMGCPTTLRELCAAEVPVEAVAALAVPEGRTLGNFQKLTRGDVEAILRAAR